MSTWIPVVVGGSMVSEVEFFVDEKENFTLVHFELKEPISHDVLKSLKAPKVDPRKGVVISGRGPIWLHCFLAHEYHPTKFVAHYDPRLGGAVVVQSHSPDVKEGELIPLEI